MPEACPALLAIQAQLTLNLKLESLVPQPTSGQLPACTGLWHSCRAGVLRRPLRTSRSHTVSLYSRLSRKGHPLSRNILRQARQARQAFCLRPGRLQHFSSSPVTVPPTATTHAAAAQPATAAQPRCRIVDAECACALCVSVCLFCPFWL